MTSTLHTDHVELTLDDDGTWTARWPAAGISLGPCRARVEAGGAVVPAPAGSWAVDGDQATWTAADRRLHLDATGAIVTATLTWTAPDATTLDRLVPVEGTMAPAPSTRLVDGYDSWSWSGVLPGDRPGHSFWDALFATADGGGLGVHALRAESLCTVVHSDGAAIEAACGGTPDLEQVPGTWGFVAHPPRALGLPVAANASVSSEPVAIGAGPDALRVGEGLAGAAGRAAGARHWHGRPITGWESWYQYGLHVNPEDVLENARLLHDRFRDQPGFDLVQIDDGWQQTYGAWWANDRWPDDLGEIVRPLHEQGLRAGLWLAPFMVVPEAPGLATDHPDWMLVGDDGAPIVDRHQRWALDASRPEVLDFLRDLGAQVRDWGFEMVKLDFLYLAAQPGRRHDPAVTPIAALRAGLRAFVEGLGDDRYVLGCGMPVLPAVGICHGNRIGHDTAMPRVYQSFGHPTDEDWTGFRGIAAQARNVAARWAQHGRWYACDPDIVMAWGGDGADPAGYSHEEARTLAVVAALCGGPFFLADDLAQLTEPERAVLEDLALLDLAWGDGFEPLDLFARPDAPAAQHAFARPTDLASVWLASRAGDTVCALFNWTDEPAVRQAPNGITVEVPAHGVRLVDLGS